MPVFRISEVPRPVQKLFLLAQSKIDAKEITPEELELAAQWVDAQGAGYKDEPSGINFLRSFDTGARARIGMRTYYNALVKRIRPLSRIFNNLGFRYEEKRSKLPSGVYYLESMIAKSRFLSKVEDITYEDFCFLLSGKTQGRKSFEELIKTGQDLFQQLTGYLRPYEEVSPNILIDEINNQTVEFLKCQSLSKEEITGFINLINKATAMVRNELGIVNGIKIEQFQEKEVMSV